MKKNIFQYTKILTMIAATTVLLSACNKKDLVVDANYPSQSVGIAEAAVATVGPGGSGIYTLTPNVTGQAYRFVASTATGKLNVPLGVIRSGVDFKNAITVDISATTDTITKLLTLGKLPAGTEILPSSAFTLPASANIPDGLGQGDFTMVVDLNFLITNIAKKYAVAVGIFSGKNNLVNPKLSLAVIYIDPSQVLIPVANFSTYVDNTSRTGGVTNLSSNGISYSWDFGDGSPALTSVSPTHKYATSGTYTISLTTTGVTGTPSVKTTSITIL